jgi:hypothetical protein
MIRYEVIKSGVLIEHIDRVAAAGVSFLERHSKASLSDSAVVKAVTAARASVRKYRHRLREILTNSLEGVRSRRVAKADDWQVVQLL